jgi:hypothetical protein
MTVEFRDQTVPARLNDGTLGTKTVLYIFNDDFLASSGFTVDREATDGDKHAFAYAYGQYLSAQTTP